MNTKRLAAMVLGLLLLRPGVARAYFADLGGGARAVGMGGAFTAISDDVYSIYYNPAGLAQISNPQASASYSQLLTGLSDGSNLGLSQLAYAQPLGGGRQGTLGVSWQRFGLDSIYSEQTYDLSYGRKIFETNSGSSLMLGGNFQYLYHSFTPLPEAYNSCQGFNCTGGVDPLLTGRSGQGAPDSDLGLLYKLPSDFQFGLDLEHVMEPNVAFGGTDKLPINIHSGVAYMVPWMNLSAELDENQLPDGTEGTDFIIGGERFFPSLDWGEFGVRGSLGYGSEDWKQMTLGLSYRINKIEFDYAFILPLGTQLNTTGNQVFNLTFRFGSPTPTDELTADLLKKARLIREGIIPIGLALPENQPLSLDDPLLAEVRRLVDAGRFAKASQALELISKQRPKNESLKLLLHRLELIAAFYPRYERSSEEWSRTFFVGLKDFLRGQDHLAMLHGSYALSLDPNDVTLDDLVTKMEPPTRIKADRVSQDNPLGFIGTLLYRAEAANNGKDYLRVAKILSDILELEPHSPIALERLGSTDYILGRYPQAVDDWTRALKYEKDADEISALNQYIDKAHHHVASAESPSGAQTAPAISTPVASGVSLPQALPTPAPRTLPVVKSQANPAFKARPLSAKNRELITKLYRQGLQYYAAGDYLHAAASFLKIIQIDPKNADARKALERLRMRRQ